MNRLKIEWGLSGGEFHELLNRFLRPFNRQIILAPVRHKLSKFRPSSSLAFFPGSGGGFTLAWTPAAPGKMQTNAAAPLGGRPLALISSRDTSRGRPPLITRGDSVLAGGLREGGPDATVPVRPSRPVHARGASWLLPLPGADRLHFFLRGKTAAAGRRSARGMTARSRAGGSREADGRDSQGGRGYPAPGIRERGARTSAHRRPCKPHHSRSLAQRLS